jgi:alpha-ketoglutarate-dependent taurine dioxygenase
MIAPSRGNWQCTSAHSCYNSRSHVHTGSLAAWSVSNDDCDWVGENRRTSGVPVSQRGHNHNNTYSSLTIKTTRRQFASQPVIEDDESQSSEASSSSMSSVSVCSVNVDGTQVTVRWGNNNNNDNDNDQDYTTTGSTGTSASSSFHAPWLWANDPSHVQPSSKNKLLSPSSYYHSGAPTIANARIQTVSSHLQLLKQQQQSSTTLKKNDNDGQQHCFNSYSSRDCALANATLPVPPPSPGTGHSIAAYGEEQEQRADASWRRYSNSNNNVNKDEDKHEHDHEQYVLQVKWKLESSITSSSITPSDKEQEQHDGHGHDPRPSCKFSFYDLNWLQYWSYDNSSRTKRTANTEVTQSAVHAVSLVVDDDNSIMANKDKEEFVSKSKQQHYITSTCGEPKPTIQYDDVEGVPVFDFHTILPRDPILEEYNRARSNHNYNHRHANTFANPEGVQQVLKAVFSKGAALIRHVPDPLLREREHHGDDRTSSSGLDDETERAVSALGRALSGGDLSHGGLYGDIFHVASGQGGGNNVAYTNVELKMHQDLAYYESPPGLQLLHCVEFSDQVVGGESTLMDGMAAAYHFRQACPEHFETLTKVPATFLKQRPRANMTYKRPHIVTVNDDTKEEIVTVNWSPPFEGPLSCDSDMVEPYYRAYHAFDTMLNRHREPPQPREERAEADGKGDKQDDDDELLLLSALSRYASDFTWEYRLQPGEILVFSNRRMLHGRNEFHHRHHLDRGHRDATTSNGPTSDENKNEAATPRRHFVGCYTNIDDTLNRYRVLQLQHDRELLLGCNDHDHHATIDNNKNDCIHNVGNGSSLVS